MSAAFTPGPWPLTRTGDGKRYVVGDGLVEGPNGYEVAEVYSDDCDRDVAEANARLIAAAPQLFDACEDALAAFKLLVAGLSHDRAIIDMINPHIDELECVLAKVREQ